MVPVVPSPLPCGGRDRSHVAVFDLTAAERPGRIEEARVRFLEFYGSHMVDETYTYPGVEATLRHFSSLGKRMAVVTNKPEGLAEGILKELGLRSVFGMVVGGDTVVNKKPHPEPIELVLKGFGVDRPMALFVGDSAIDAATGKEAGVYTVGVSYGFGGGGAAVRDAGFDLVIDGFSELKGLID